MMRAAEGHEVLLDRLIHGSLTFLAKHGNLFLPIACRACGAGTHFC